MASNAKKDAFAKFSSRGSQRFTLNLLAVAGASQAAVLEKVMITAPTARLMCPTKAEIWPGAASEKHVGPPGEIRTPDTQVRSLVLYPAELRAEARSLGSLP